MQPLGPTLDLTLGNNLFGDAEKNMHETPIRPHLEKKIW